MATVNDSSNGELQGASAADVVSSGPNGNDTFAWAHADNLDPDGSNAKFDHTLDFGAGERFDFSQLFAGPTDAAADEVLQVTGLADSLVIATDLGSGFVDVVVLEGVYGVDIDDLIAAQALIV
jgi:hypothetical protein